MKFLIHLIEKRLYSEEFLQCVNLTGEGEYISENANHGIALHFLFKNFEMHFYNGVQVHSATRSIIRRRTRKFPSGLERDSAPIRGGNRA